MKVKLKDILPNPHRRIDTYPIRGDKLEALKASIGSTGWWKNVVVRKSPTKTGKYELAYGHHRLAALKALNKPGDAFEFVVEKLSDDDMLKMMASENQEEWGARFWVVLETVRALIDAKASGGAEGLEAKAKKGEGGQGCGWITIPSVAGAGRQRSEAPVWISATQIGDYFDWHDPRGKPKEMVQTAIRAIQLIEAGFLKNTDFHDIGNKQARALVKEVSLPEKRLTAIAEKHEVFAKEAETKGMIQAADTAKALAAEARQMAKEAPKAAAKSMTASFKHGRSIDDAAETARRLTWDFDPYKEPPKIDAFALSLCRRLDKILDEHNPDPTMEKLMAVQQHLDALSPSTTKELVDALREIGLRARNFRDQLQSDPKQLTASKAKQLRERKVTQ